MIDDIPLSTSNFIIPRLSTITLFFTWICIDLMRSLGPVYSNISSANSNITMQFTTKYLSKGPDQSDAFTFTITITFFVM